MPFSLFKLPSVVLLTWRVLALWLCMSGLAACNSSDSSTAAGAAGGRTAKTAPAAAAPVLGGPQPVLDSMAVIRAMRDEPLFAPQELPARRFYRARGFALGWFKNHQVRPQAEVLLAEIAKAKDEGLESNKYQSNNITSLLAELKTVGRDTARRSGLERRTDLALTGTYMAWASDYYRGVANPRDVKGGKWEVKPNKIKLHKALLTFLGERKSRYNYYEFAPLHPEYEQLKKALAAYRAQEQAGGWPKLPAGLKLKPGDSSAAVPALRQRLLGAAGSPGGGTATPHPSVGQAGVAATGNVYDPALVAAVKTFQQDAGLKANGLLGAGTVAELNVPITARIDQLILNMERWRWLPKRFEDNYLLVNIPEYRLHVIEQGKEAFSMRVIVGKLMHETPIFSDRMEFVVLSPYWNVPFSIIANELRPKLVANPHYLDRLDMEVVKGEGSTATPIDPASINWATATEDNFKYTLRRRPGPQNDLGDVKFLFPNSNNVYLHDTPHNELFAESQRDFSHGCVRVQEPIKLAAYLLRKSPEWSQQNILSAVAKRQEKYVALKEKLPVYLVYFTAWADADGRPHFRDDIYGHDKALAKEYFN